MKKICIILPLLLVLAVVNLSWASASGEVGIVSKKIKAPEGLTAKGYDSHVELKWKSSGADVTYKVYASIDGGATFMERGETTDLMYMDFVNKLGHNLDLAYKVAAVKGKKTSAFSTTVSASTSDFSDDQLINMVQEYTFRYFWDNADPRSGWAFERIPNMKDGGVITSGGTGFGIMAVMVGAERGWVSREAAVERLLKLTASLKKFERFHGMWAHWYDSESEKVYHFSEYDDGGDIVESAFMAQGLLAARQYFNKDSSKEKQLRKEITGLWEAMEWNWYTKSGAEKQLYWHWSKNHGWKMNHTIHGYNEALIVYFLAVASPTHPISKWAYHDGWAGWNNKEHRNYNTYYGMSLPLGNKDQMGGPLFFAHYSYLGLNPKGLRDRYANYWEQNRRHVLINRSYCIDNPYNWTGYGEDLWGLTAGDLVPQGYSASAPGWGWDQGTINPTGALSSMPYAPAEVMKVLKNLYRNYGKELFGPMGFYDGINLTVSDKPEEQVVKSYLAIDQGPIVVMMENYRSGLIWKYFMKDPDVRNGLNELEFTIDGKKVERVEKK